MENLNLLEFLIITLNCNVTIVGVLWLVVAVLLRMLLVVLAGSPIYQDEQERFVCNTLQPGCANVCYDLFSPVSPLRFWLVQSLALLLPSVAFGAFALHRGSRLAAAARRPRVPDLSAAYLAHLLLRTPLEAGLAALQYLLFGFSVPAVVSCSRVPCSGAVDCYVSRPTEKSLLLLSLWALSALSFLLSVADLLCSLARRPRASRRWVKGEAGPVCEGPTPSPGPVQDPRGCHAQDGGQEAQGVPELPRAWTAGQGGCSHAGQGGAGRVQHSDHDVSEAASSAGDQLTEALTEHEFRSHRETSPDTGAEATRSDEPPRHCLASLPQAPGRLATSGSAPHLRPKKSEWV
nr:gap junction delta-4 protein [Meriones unguiculatus]